MEEQLGEMPMDDDTIDVLQEILMQSKEDNQIEDSKYTSQNSPFQIKEENVF